MCSNNAGNPDAIRIFSSEQCRPGWRAYGCIRAHIPIDDTFFTDLIDVGGMDVYELRVTRNSVGMRLVTTNITVSMVIGKDQ
jgi:hypothetical protein